MKKGLLIITLMLAAGLAQAQNTDINGIIKEGIKLNSDKDYIGAMTKYNRALAIDPENAQANYQMAYTLNAAGSGLEGIPYLNKVIKTG
ncbi:MAG TPA: tetratricopeptide repeat protein, partial [Mucilaginibacter sp.]